jgi:hypothetical protein
LLTKRLKTMSWPVAGERSGSESERPLGLVGLPGVAGAPIGSVDVGVGVVTTGGGGVAALAVSDLYVFGPCHAIRPSNTGASAISTIFCFFSFC